MLSKLVVSTQRFVVIIDELGQEKIGQKFVCQLLREQGHNESSIKVLPLSAALKEPSTFANFLNECCGAGAGGDEGRDSNWNVILPPMAGMLTFQSAATIFEFLNKLRKCEKTQRVFLWLSTRHLLHPHAAYVIGACQYMADLILHLDTTNELSIVTRKSGGGVTNKRYSYKICNNEFLVEEEKRAKSKSKSPEETATTKPEQLGTFKIELDEEEIVARNAMKLPYEKTSESNEGAIIYTPDAADDFDDEDPDEDLCI